MRECNIVGNPDAMPVCSIPDAALFDTVEASARLEELGAGKEE